MGGAPKSAKKFRIYILTLWKLEEVLHSQPRKSCLHFAWQAQYFQARIVVLASFSCGRRSTCDMSKVLVWRIAGRAACTCGVTCVRSRSGVAFCDCGGNFACCDRRQSTVYEQFLGNSGFLVAKCENWRKSRTNVHFVYVYNLEKVSRETALFT